MTAGEWARLGAALLVALFGSSVIATLIQYRFLNPKVKAEASKLTAETRSIEIDDQTDIINNLREEMKRLKTRADEQDAKLAAQDDKIDRQGRTIAEQGDQIAALQRKNRDLAATMRTALADLLGWIHRALSVMSPDQQASVGQPPDYNHLITVQERS